MEMRIGNRTIVANIRTRDAAREEFERAQAAGLAASLLEQQRPNVFTMELANILPGLETHVTVEYVEPLAPIDGVYAFTFPTVVGPRYVGAGKDSWKPGSDGSNLTTHVNLHVVGSVLGLSSTPAALSQVAVMNGTTVTTFGDKADVVISFWFTERAVGAQLLLGSFAQEQFFALAVQPPQRRLLQQAQISKREYLFILDVSGSMTGFPIELSKRLVMRLLQDNVREGDSLNILLFAGGSAVLNEQTTVKATNESVSNALQWLDDNMKAGGGTELLPALRRAYKLPRLHADAARTIVVMTDGWVAVEQEAFDLVRANLGAGNVFVFGVGSSINHYIVEGLARVGQGEPFVVASEEQGDEVALKLQRYIDSPVLTRLSLAFEGVATRELEPPHLGDVFASRPIQVVGKWEAEGGRPVGRVRLSGRLADGSAWEYAQELAELPLTRSPAVPLLWARARIALLSDYAGVMGARANEAEITALGLNYSLMTSHTSFVAVDSDPATPGVCRAPTTTTPEPQELADGSPETADAQAMFNSRMSPTAGPPSHTGAARRVCAGVLTLATLPLAIAAFQWLF